MLDIIKKIFILLDKQDKKILIFLVLFSFFVSFIETAGIGLIMPFISIATDFNKIFENKYLYEIYKIFNFKNQVNFVIFFGIGLILFYIFRGIVSYIYLYTISKFSQSKYYQIAYKLFENYIGLHYKEFINRNSSEFFKTIISEAHNSISIINSLLSILTEIIVLLFIYVFLLYVNFKMTLLITVFLGINILIIKLIIKNKIKKAGVIREKYLRKFFKILNSSFGNFKMIKLRGNEEKLFDEFKSYTSQFINANLKNQTLSQIPRIYLEAVAFSLIAIIVVFLILKFQHSLKDSLSVLMAFILGLYRMLPSVNRILTSYNHILYLQKGLDVVHNDLMYEKEELGNEEIEFNKNIKVKDLYFEYNKNKPVLKNINLTINKGEKIGIIGQSGSGKSTLIDIIIGLYKPQKGKILIDDVELNRENLKSWRKKIGYIPQMIYLFDGTVAENVTFGEKIDEERIKEVLRQANILDFLEKHHEGIHTIVGEGGVKLSGGQRQRIAIARALYSDPEILVLDEATSALDNETEKKIMEEIYKIGKNKTMIIIAHRLSTLDGCDRIIKLENGEIIYED